MARGQKTPAVKVAEFRAAYLRLRNAREAARQTGISERTGVKLARELQSDPEFAQECAELRAHAKPEAEALLMECVRTAFRRIQDEPLNPEELAELINEKGLKSFSIQDPRPAYMAQIVNTLKVLNQDALAVTEAQRSREPITIQYLRPDSVSDDDDPVSS